MQMPQRPGEEDTMKVAADHQSGAGQPDTTELLRVLDAGLSPGLLERALTHRSYAYENGGLPTNERLEFLGDSVLGLVVTDALFRGYPELPEGHLAKLRAAVVNMRALAGVARGLRLGEYLRLGRGEDGTGGRDKSSILADTLEAVIGAVYIERGLPGSAPAWTGRPRCRNSPRPGCWACPSITSKRAARTIRSHSVPWSGWAATCTAAGRGG